MSSEYEYKLSVVVIVYNTENYLEECLDSLIMQTLDDIEIICVNNDSTDGSLNILQKYSNEYPNIRIINQENLGGAIAGNVGLKEAKGEYVTIIDSDDFVMSTAYEKMYKKAKETDADIVVGRAYRYSGNHLYFLEQRIELSAYWNKIFKNSFVEDNEIYMIPHRLYADSPLITKAFLSTNKIEFIPDYVYSWRKRDINESVTKKRNDIDNLKDRLELYDVLKDYYGEDKDKLEFAVKALMEMFYVPIDAILADDEFGSYYITKMKEILTDLKKPINYEYSNVIFDIYGYLILNNHIDILKEFIAKYLEFRDIIHENGKTYWNLKYFRNPEYDFPDELFEINSVYDNFINLDNVRMDSEFFYLDNISLPKNVKFDKVNLLLSSKAVIYDTKDKNSITYELTNSGDNTFNAKIPLDELGIDYYYIFLEFQFGKFVERYIIKKDYFNSDVPYKQFGDKSIIEFTSIGNLILSNGYSKEMFNMIVDEESMKFISSNRVNSNYEVFIRSTSKDRVNFIKILNDFQVYSKEMKLDWKYSLDKNVDYNIFIEINNQVYKLTTDFISNFEEKSINFNDGQIHITKNYNGSISIIWQD